jgi:hypothetical protein
VSPPALDGAFPTLVIIVVTATHHLFHGVGCDSTERDLAQSATGETTAAAKKAAKRIADAASTAHKGRQATRILALHIGDHTSHITRVTRHSARKLATSLLLQILGELRALIGVHSGKRLLGSALHGIRISMLGDSLEVIKGFVIIVTVINWALFVPRNKIVGPRSAIVAIVVVIATEEPAK